MSKINEKELDALFWELKKDNSEIAFQKLYTNYNKLIYGIAFSFVKNKEDAEDIVQIFFSKLYTIGKEKLPNENPASWIYAVTKNEAISLLRKKKNDFDLETIYDVEDNHDEINNIIDKVEFNKLISKLNDQEREIVALKILTNLSFDEIAKLLNKPSGTIKWRYYKAVHTLKLLLSNLAMFILTFAIGISSLFNNKKENNETRQDLLTNNDTTEDKDNNRVENTTDETLKQHPAGNASVQIENKIDEALEDTITEEIHEDNLNYIGIGIIGVSSIFLITTIIFTLLFAKYQLKSKKKPSK